MTAANCTGKKCDAVVSELIKVKEGDMGVYGIELYFGNFIFNVRQMIALSSSPAICGFSSFWLTIFGKDPSRTFTVLRYHLLALSCLIQVNTMCSTNHSKLND